VIGTDVVEKMMQHGQFFLGQVTLMLSDPRAETNISLCFADTSPSPIFYPISGFPKCLLEEERKTRSKRRHVYSLGRTRTPTKLHTRGTWAIPNHIDNSFNPIQRYRDPGYVFPGDATPDAISAISQRFSPASLPGPSGHYPSVPEIGGIERFELPGDERYRPEAYPHPLILDREVARDQRFELEGCLPSGFLEREFAQRPERGFEWPL
jgi:hypothetical protein